MGTITVTQLCRTAGINRRTFYIHYDRIADIFEDYEIELSEQVSAALRGRPSDPARLLQTFDTILQANFTGFKYLCINDQHHALVDKLQVMLFNTVSSVLLTGHPRPDQQVAIQYMCAGLINTYVYWFKHPNGLTATDVMQVNQELAWSTIQEIGKI